MDAETESESNHVADIENRWKWKSKPNAQCKPPPRFNKAGQIVLVIGNSGVGKSTFALFMTDNDLESVEDPETGEFAITHPKVGRSIISKTVFPDVMVDATNTTFYDCPGFRDNRGTCLEIGQAAVVKNVIGSADFVKFIVVESYDSLKADATRGTLLNMLQSVCTLIVDIEKYKDSIVLVATKVEGSPNDDIMIKRIVKSLREAYQQIQAEGTTLIVDERVRRNVRGLLEIFLTVEGHRYPKIGLFRRPDAAGKLSDIKTLQVGKEKLKKMIFHHSSFREPSNKDFHITLSSKAKFDIVRFIDETTFRIEREVVLLSALLRDYIHSSVLFSSDFGKIVIFLEQAQVCVRGLLTDIEQFRVPNSCGGWPPGACLKEDLYILSEDLRYKTFLQEVLNVTFNLASPHITPIHNVGMYLEQILSFHRSMRSVVDTLPAAGSGFASKEAAAKIVSNLTRSFVGENSILDLASPELVLPDTISLEAHCLEAIANVVAANGAVCLRHMGQNLVSYVDWTVQRGSDTARVHDELQRAVSCLNHIGRYLSSVQDDVDTRTPLATSATCSEWPEGSPVVEHLHSFLQLHIKFLKNVPPDKAMKIFRGVEKSFEDLQNYIQKVWIVYSYFAVVPSKILDHESESCEGDSVALTNCEWLKVVRSNWLLFNIPGNDSLPIPSLRLGWTGIRANVQEMADREKIIILGNIDRVTRYFANRVAGRNISISLKIRLLDGAVRCMNSIKHSMRTLDSVIPCKIMLHITDYTDNIQKLSRFLTFVKYVRGVVDGSMMSTFKENALTSVIKYVEDLKLQYEYLELLHENLVNGTMSLASNESMSMNIAKWGNTDEENDMTIENRVFFDKLHEFSDPVEMDLRRDLFKVLNMTSSNVTLAIEERDEQSVFSGFVVRLSQLQPALQSAKSRTIIVFAMQAVLIDVDLNFFGVDSGRRLAILAPRWFVIGPERVIRLRGSNGESSGDLSGVDGMPGLPGGPGGSVLAFVWKMHNGRGLTFSLPGGNGGNGKDGMPGGNGENGQDKSMGSSVYGAGCSKIGGIRGFWRYYPTYYCAIDGEEGHRGGHGGRGGAGGLRGEMLLFELEGLSGVSVESSPGERGADGRGGEGGQGGVDGNVLKMQERWWGNEYQVVERYTRAQNGDRGIDGAMTYDQKVPKHPFSFTDIHAIINMYQDWLLKHPHALDAYSALQFLDKMYETALDKNYLHPMGFAREIQQLEENFYHAGQPQFFLPIYESFLQRILKFKTGSSPLINQIEIATRSRIVSSRAALELQVVVDVAGYLRMALHSLQDFKEKLFARKVPQIQDIKPTIVQKMLINSNFIDTHVRFEIENLLNSSTESRNMSHTIQHATSPRDDVFEDNVRILEKTELTGFVLNGFWSVFSLSLDILRMIYEVPTKNVTSPHFGTHWESHLTNVLADLSKQLETARRSTLFPDALIRILETQMEAIRKLAGVRTFSDLNNWYAVYSYKSTKMQIMQVSLEFPEALDSVQYALDLVKSASDDLRDLFDLLRKYEDKRALTHQLAVLALPETTQSDDQTVEEIMACNLVLTQYTDAMAGLKQWAFPYAAPFKEIVELPRDSLNTGSAMNFTDVAIESIRNLKNDFEKKKTILSALDGVLFRGDFGGIGTGAIKMATRLPPFIVWRRQIYGRIIDQLLSGGEVALRSDIMASSLNLDAVKFNEVSIAFHADNETIQDRLQEVMSGFRIRMMHHGRSYYKCGRNVFSLMSESQIIEFSLRRKPSGDPDGYNDIYMKLKLGSPVLSPYALWTLKLIPAEQNATFDQLQQFSGMVDIQLIGHGTYISNVLCDTELDRFYTVESTAASE